MSYRTGEDRPILKARRFSKFESTSAAISNDYVPDKVITSTSETFRRPGFKRPYDESYTSAPKKFCDGLQVSSSTPRNLANNRLQRLKQSLKFDLDQKNVRKETISQSSDSYVASPRHNENGPHVFQTSVQFPVPGLKSNNQNVDKRVVFPAKDITENFTNESSEMEPIGFRMPHLKSPANCSESHDSQSPLHASLHSRQTTPKNIYQNLDKWANSPDEHPAKNLANQRLNRLKRIVNNIKSTVDLDSPNNDCRHFQNSQDDKYQCNNDRASNMNDDLDHSLHKNKISGTKRNMDDSEIDVEASPIKRPIPFTHNSSIFNTTPESFYIQSPCNTNNDKKSENTNFSSPESSSKLPSKSSPNVSNRIMRIKRNMEAINNNTLNHERLPVKNSKIIQDICYSPRKDMNFEFENSKHKNAEKNWSHDPCKQPTESQGIKPNGNFINTQNQKSSNASYNRNNKDEKCKTESNSDTFSKVIPVSHRLKSNGNNPDQLHDDSNSKHDATNSNLGPYWEPPKLQEPVSPPKTPTTASNSDNYKGKWEMTAAWVWNHQNVNGTPSGKSENVPSSEIVVEPIVEKEDHLNETEDMEWTNAEPDTEATEQQELKETDIEVEEKSKDQEVVQKSKVLCIVVDTNVFISGLSKVKDIMNLKITEPFLPIIYVPWMVITELDYMKHSCSDSKLKQNVLNAIKFINVTLQKKNPRFLGQTINDMEKQKSIGISPDDKIVSCCLQATQKYDTVILLSNDLNLRSKVMINNISASSANEIIMKILSKATKTAKSQKVMQKMSMLCSSVICECAKETYGDVWSKMDLLANPPWSLRECLKRFRKYWPTVFKDKVMKQFTMAVDQLLAIFHRNRYFADDSEDYVNFMKLCINLCIFLKDIHQCRGSVENTLRDITKI